MARPQGICRLCGQLGELQQSHILPAFVFRWLKDGGNIRSSHSVNQRVQDGPKAPWLCLGCERLLGAWETRFATDLFHPFTDDPFLKLTYSDWLLKFCVSVSWRALNHVRELGPIKHFSATQLDSVEAALATWRAFLLGTLPNPGRFEQHLLAFAGIESADLDQPLPPNINRYLLRGVEIDLAANSSSAFVYSKLGRFAVFGFIDVARPRTWVGSRIAVRQGRFGPQDYRLPGPVGPYLLDRAKRAWTMMDTLSPPQQAKVEGYVLENIDRFSNSDLFRAMEMDVELFGDAAFRSPT